MMIDPKTYSQIIRNESLLELKKERNRLIEEIMEYENANWQEISRVGILNNMKMDEYRVMRLMRHHSFESIEPYMKMTAEDVRDMRSEYTQDTFDIIQSVVGKDWK